MQYKEAVKKSELQEDLFMIVLSMELTNPDDLIQEMREWKEIVMDWYAARKQAATEVRFIAVSEVKYHQAIEEFTELCHANDVDLKGVFKSVKLHLDLHDGIGTKIRERIFEIGKEDSNLWSRWFGQSKQRP
ncbi:MULTISPECIES: hypothetical protein [Burkholderia]|jgi:DnaJ-domain-containing protein 1|uniref:Uncharacterized protein n=2 Tax=Burkholderia contaminans TaxID=488447 RepID=A0A1E3FML3_9BURK|nr:MULTISPECIES: hypothetical protein [Burkholderia]UTP24443.1 hypothetical protein NMB33_28490 [Burkholderia sp. FXe9]KKL32020.1 hypothetical protein WR31_30310 [Burkholderia contaminans LMG 23361]MBA9831930.1 hypothetical protein [Burkholderia contaminans]MBA9838693.1 hypothetical protein [Burkholderia contaminans]MBA9863911.1 hypothetical protein [Burkholderia contaminans]